MVKRTVDLYGDRIGKVDYVDHLGSDLTCVNAARVSYGKQKDVLEEKDKKLIKYLIDNRHDSCFEHCQITFRCKVPLFVRSQHHRHRTQSYNEVSRRYTEDNLQFYEPKEWRVQSKSSKQASESSGTLDHEDLTQLNHANVDYCMKNYHKMLQRGVAKEMARMLLPQNLYTEYYASANLRNWIHFLKLRLHEHAQAEIKEMAEGMKVMLDELYPVTMSMMKW